MGDEERIIALRNSSLLLSLSFQYPNKKLLNFIMENIPHLKLSIRALGIDETILNMLNFEGDPNKILNELQVEYTRLFIGSPPVQAPCPPYESFWKKRKIMSHLVDELKELLNEVNLRISPDFKDLPDHIAVVFEFMFYIYNALLEILDGKRKDGLEKFIDLKKRFIKSHIGWIIEFCDKLNNEARLDFYKCLANLSKALIKHMECELTGL